MLSEVSQIIEDADALFLAVRGFVISVVAFGILIWLVKKIRTEGKFPFNAWRRKCPDIEQVSYRQTKRPGPHSWALIARIVQAR